MYNFLFVSLFFLFSLQATIMPESCGTLYSYQFDGGNEYGYNAHSRFSLAAKENEQLRKILSLTENKNHDLRLKNSSLEQQHNFLKEEITALLFVIEAAKSYKEKYKKKYNEYKEKYNNKLYKYENKHKERIKKEVKRLQKQV